MKTREERFWTKVNKDGPVPPHLPFLGPCWMWTANTWKASRRGVFSWAQGKCVLAYRAAWLLAHGPIPERTQVLHRCDNPTCVRPEHLFLGTQSDNMLDAIAKGRHTSDVTRGRQNPNLRGSRNGFAKLTEADVRAIRIRLATGETQTSIAARYGVSFSTVNLIHAGKTWRHVA